MLNHPAYYKYWRTRTNRKINFWIWFYIESLILTDEYYLRIESISDINKNLFFEANSAFENQRDSDVLLIQ